MSSHSQTSLPSVVHVFQSGIRTPPASSLDELIRHQLEAAAREVAVAAASDDAQRRDRESKTLVTDMGEYLTQAARVWSRLTENLVQGAHMDAAAIDAHERSLKQSRVADLSAVVTMDIERSKLWYEPLFSFLFLSLVFFLFPSAPLLLAFLSNFIFVCSGGVHVCMHNQYISVCTDTYCTLATCCHSNKNNFPSNLFDSR